MSWADEFYSLDDYLNWLITGKQDTTVQVKGLEWVTEQDVMTDIRHIFTHRGIDLEQFSAFLVQFLKAFTHYARQCPSPTLDVFGALQERVIPDREEAAELIRTVGIPRTCGSQPDRGSSSAPPEAGGKLCR